MNKTITTIIFDLDGVITSTDEYHYLAWKEITNELNIPFDRKANEQFRGASRSDCVNILLKDYKSNADENFKSEMAAKKNEIYKTYLKKITPESVSNDVKETLKELKKLGYKLAIGSSSKNTPLILQQIGYEDFFDAVSDGNQIKNSKPHPEVFLLTAQKLGKKPEECLVVGDAKTDIQAANAGGMKSAAISHAANMKLGDYQLNSLSDLLKILEMC